MSSSVPRRLVAIGAKIEWAKDHIRDLESRLRSFRKTDPYGLRVENDPQTGERVYRVEIRGSIPCAIPILTGEILYQLRSSLDHLVWQLVEAGGSTPDERTAFPICKSSAEHYSAKMRRKVQGMSPQAISTLDALQPYQGGNDLLWRLHHLNNIDKHRLLLVVAFGGDVPIYCLAPNRSARSKVRRKITFVGYPDVDPGRRFAILQDGAEVGRVSGDAESEVGKEFQFPFEIAFGEPQIVHGEAVVPFLHQSTSLVDGIVRQFIPFL